MKFEPHEIRDILPSYLAAEDQVEILKQLRKFYDSKGQYVSLYMDRYKSEKEKGFLQGDSWLGFEVYSLAGGEKVKINALIISNSCDISEENQRDLPPAVSVVPLIKISKFESILQEIGITHDKIKAKVESIKRQKVTSMIFFPGGAPDGEDCFANLSDIYSIDLKTLSEMTEKKKIFSLNNSGFYLLLLKISNHFARMQEKIQRG